MYLIGLLHILLKRTALIVNGDAAITRFQESIEKLLKDNSRSKKVAYLEDWLNKYAGVLNVSIFLPLK